MESKRKNVYITIFVITTIIAAGLAIFFKVDGDNKLKSMEAKVEESSKEVNTNESSKENDESQNSIDISKDNIDKDFNLPVLDGNKCINNLDKVTKYNLCLNFEGITCRLSDDNKSVMFWCDWNRVKSTYGVSIPSGVAEASKEIQISNFDKEISSIYILGFGHEVGRETLLFLMKDGTVEYMPIAKALKEQEFKSYGMLPDVEKVSLISQGNCVPEFGGWADIFAIKDDGSFYILGEILKGTGNYNF